MSHIIHAVINMTEQVQAEARLRESQTREQAANAAAEAQRQQLYQTFQEAPAMICVFDGPQHVFQFVNPPYQALVGTRPLVGKPIAEAMPELAGQPIFELLDGVYRTGETFRANEMLVQLDHDNLGSQALEKRYYNFIYQARHNLSGAVNGIFVFAYDVTTQALARQQVQELNEELAASNEELHASNEEFLNANAELTHAQLQFQQLNQELETRVAARTQDARAARAATERQRRQLEDLFMRAPAAICILSGPELVYELANPGYQQLFPGRRLLGLPLLQALPELEDQPIMAILHGVYDTGIPFEGKAVLVPLARDEDGPIEDSYFDLTYQARFDEMGHVDGFVTYANDVTEQVLARRQRATQEQRLLELFEQAPVAIAVFRVAIAHRGHAQQAPHRGKNTGRFAAVFPGIKRPPGCRLWPPRRGVGAGTYRTTTLPRSMCIPQVNSKLPASLGRNSTAVVWNAGRSRWMWKSGISSSSEHELSSSR